MQFAVNVVVLTSTYALLALGYVLIYRVSRVLNLAHGSLMLLAGYVAFALAGLLPGQPLLVTPLTVIAAAASGALVYWLLIKPMSGRPVFATVLLTVALGIALDGLMVLLWSPRVLYPATALDITDSPIALPFNAALPTLGLASIAACAIVISLVTVLLRGSRLGARMLAAAENPLLVAQRGIDVHRLFAFTWALALASAALAGTLYTLAHHLEGSVAIVGLKAFPAALVGGLGSPSGIVPGAFLVALAEVSAIQLGSPQLSNVAPFLVLLVALLIRPWGLLGSPEEIERV